MTTYTAEPATGSCDIMRETNGRRTYIGTFFADGNPNYIRDAEMTADTLNKFEEKNVNFNIAATITEQKN